MRGYVLPNGGRLGGSREAISIFDRGRFHFVLSKVSFFGFLIVMDLTVRGTSRVHVLFGETKFTRVKRRKAIIQSYIESTKGLKRDSGERFRFSYRTLWKTQSL